MTSAPTAAGRRPRGDLRNYALVTGAYWTDTLVDGATRTLVLFYFDRLGYSPLQVASLFILYEVAGMLTNLFGGFLAARWGLKVTLFMGLGVQVLALLMLGLAPASLLVVPYVMASQALSGVAKDLTKMSSKSAVKLVVAENDQSALYRWVAILTGSKNALKGVGFFLGGLLLTLTGFRAATLIMAGATLIALALSTRLMHGHLGNPDKGAKFRQMFSNNRAINVLAAARIFLFASRDVWFVVGLAVLPLLRTRLVLLAGRHAAGRVGDRLRRGTGRRAPPGAPPSAGRRPRARRAQRHMARAGARGVAGGDRGRALRARRRDGGDHRRARPLRRRLRTELSRPLLPDPRLLRQRQGGDERRLLLHGKRVRTPGGNRAVGRDVRTRRAQRLPVDVECVRAGRRRAFAAAAVRNDATRSPGGGVSACLDAGDPPANSEALVKIL